MLYEKSIEDSIMSEKKVLKLQRTESFYIREGWFEKFFEAIKSGKQDIFSKSNGTKVLGIGANMVKSLRFWVEACQLIKKESRQIELSEKGLLIADNDPFLETVFSWELIHYWLVSNKVDAPVFSALFNNKSINYIDRKHTAEVLYNSFADEGYDSPNITSIQKDVATFIASYETNNNYQLNPEETTICPFSYLKLLSNKNSEGYEKQPISLSLIDYRLLYICLRDKYREKYFNIDDAMEEEFSPVLCFNMDRSVFLYLLTEMKNNDLLELNKTAGLNTAYLKSDKTDDELFKEYLNMTNGGRKI